jgi:hypothetical protein
MFTLAGGADAPVGLRAWRGCGRVGIAGINFLGAAKLAALT